MKKIAKNKKSQKLKQLKNSKKFIPNPNEANVSDEWGSGARGYICNWWKLTVWRVQVINILGAFFFNCNRMCKGISLFILACLPPLN